MSTPIIFMDIDGPMIPTRAFRLPNQTHLRSVFDPCATSLVNELIKLSGAQIVMSSTWVKQGYYKCLGLLANNGIDVSALHKDWRTQSVSSNKRTDEIKNWLDTHPEVETYIVLDDEQLDSKILPGFIQCDMDEGFSFRNYLEAKIILGIANNMDREKLVHLQRKEIWRAQRPGDAHESLTWRFADALFPVPKDSAPHLIRGPRYP